MAIPKQQSEGIVVAIWAEEKCHKTSMALSFPKPIYHFDLDVGGFRRAAWREPIPEWMRKGWVISKSYPIPIQADKLMGPAVGTTQGKFTVKMPKKLFGYRETWQSIMADFIGLLDEDSIRTIVIDSATELWKIAHRTELQIKQEKQFAADPKLPDEKVRESLQSMEYGPPNDRMRNLLYAARAKGKNLVLTHYPTPVYASKMDEKGQMISYDTGAVQMDGFKDTPKLVDLILKLKLEKVVVNPEADKKDQQKDWMSSATIDVCGLPGLGTSVQGLTLPARYSAIRDLADNLGYQMEPEFPEEAV